MIDVVPEQPVGESPLRLYIGSLARQSLPQVRASLRSENPETLPNSSCVVKFRCFGDGATLGAFRNNPFDSECIRTSIRQEPMPRGRFC